MCHYLKVHIKSKYLVIKYLVFLLSILLSIMRYFLENTQKE